MEQFGISLDGFSWNLIWVFSKIFRENSSFIRITVTLHKDQHTFLIISHTVLLRITNVSDKRCKESQNTYLFDVHESVHHNTIMNTTNKMQLYRLIHFSLSVLHVSGDVFAHHHEHLAVFTVSGSVHPSSCRLVSWFYFQLFQKKFFHSVCGLYRLFFWKI